MYLVQPTTTRCVHVSNECCGSVSWGPSEHRNLSRYFRMSSYFTSLAAFGALRFRLRNYHSEGSSTNVWQYGFPQFEYLRKTKTAVFSVTMAVEDTVSALSSATSGEPMHQWHERVTIYWRPWVCANCRPNYSFT